MVKETVFDLERLIHPIPLGVFFSEYWDKKPLHVKRSDRRYFSGLFSVDDLDALLSNFGPPGPHGLRLAKRGGDPETIDLPASNPPDLDQIYARYRDGYTLNVNDIGAHHAGIRKLSHLLFADIGVRPHPNLYLTAAGSRAFDVHYDTHDVMILHLGGAKEWRVYKRVDESPTATQNRALSVERSEIGEPTIQTTLEAGDFIYIPRGCVHEAYTEDRFSLHLTIGTNMRTYLDLLKQMVDTAGWRSAALRASLPPGALFGRSQAEVTQTMLGLLASELGESLVAEAASDWAARDLSFSPPVERRRFVGLDEEPAVLGLDTPLRRPARLLMTLRTANGRTSIHFQSGVLEGPWRIRPALDYVMHNETLRARDLPGTLNDQEKLVLARRMLREGLLQLAQHA